MDVEGALDVEVAGQALNVNNITVHDQLSAFGRSRGFLRTVADDEIELVSVGLALDGISLLRCSMLPMSSPNWRMMKDSTASL
jgi:hypothetical protein